MNTESGKRTVRLWSAVAPILVALALAPALLSKNEVDNPPANLRFDENPLDATVRQATSLAPIVKKAAPSVVSVATTRFVETGNTPVNPWRFFFDRNTPPQEQPGDSEPVEGIGSGVIVSEDGYIRTNTHVVDDADEITVILNDGKTEFGARIVGKDELTDISVLKVDAKDLPAITIADSDQLEVGDLVLAIGNPFGVGQTVTSGMVSAKGRSGFFLRYEDYIQTDAPINPGNSGGALVDAQGRLIGLNTFIVSRTGGSAGVNFAVPANLARFVLHRVIQDGTVKRGYLGVELEATVSPELAEEFNLPDNQGALVTRVVPSGPASKADVQSGDFIVAFNGIPVTDRRSLQFEVAKALPGSDAVLTVIRNGETLKLTLTLGELDLQAMNQGPSRNPSTPAEVLEGVEMVDLNAATRRQLGLPPEAEGNVLVTEVNPQSAAAKAGLATGSLILEANHQPVESVQDVHNAASQSRSGRLLLRIRDPNGVVRYLVVTLNR